MYNNITCVRAELSLIKPFLHVRRVLHYVVALTETTKQFINVKQMLKYVRCDLCTYI